MPLLFVLFIIFWKTNVLAVCYLVLTIVGLETMEYIFAELEVEIYWDFAGITRVHFAKLVVYIEVFVWE